MQLKVGHYEIKARHNPGKDFLAFPQLVKNSNIFNQRMIYNLFEFQMAVHNSLALLLAFSCTIFQVLAMPQRGITLQERISEMEEIMLSEELLINPILPCNKTFPQNSGEQSAAEWVRIVFHDFVTADVAAGTG